MRIYLAGRYSRREELARYRDILKLRGITVTSRWLNGDHKVDDTGSPTTDDGQVLGAEKLRTRFAREDIEDVKSADSLILFTEEPRVQSASRGGRHVEFGMALAFGKALVAVGPRENLFTWLPEVVWLPSFDDYLDMLDGRHATWK